MEVVFKAVRKVSLQLLAQGSQVKNRQERKVMLISELKFSVKYRAALAQPPSVLFRVFKGKVLCLVKNSHFGVTEFKVFY